MFCYNELMTYLEKINGTTSILTILTEVVTIYGLLFALPTFIKQLYLENIFNTAKRVKELLIDIKEEIIGLAKSNDPDAYIRKLKSKLNFLINFLIEPGLNAVQNTQLGDFLKILNQHEYDTGNNDAKKLFLENIDPNWRNSIKDANKNHIKIDFIENLENDINNIIQNISVPKNEVNHFFYICLFSLFIFFARIFKFEFRLFLLFVLCLMIYLLCKKYSLDKSSQNL